MANNNVYNSYYNVRSLPKLIIDHMIKNNEDFWILLANSQETINKPPLTLAQKKAMIATSASGDNSAKQILFDVYTSDATITANAQVRLSLLDIIPTNRTNGQIRFLIQCIVSNKESTIKTNVCPIENKAFAIAQELIKSLNGTRIEGLNGAFWLDSEQDRKTGIYKSTYGNSFSGYDLVFGAQV